MVHHSQYTDENSIMFDICWYHRYDGVKKGEYSFEQLKLPLSRSGNSAPQAFYPAFCSGSAAVKVKLNAPLGAGGSSTASSETKTISTSSSSSSLSGGVWTVNGGTPQIVGPVSGNPVMHAPAKFRIINGVAVSDHITSVSGTAQHWCIGDNTEWKYSTDLTQVERTGSESFRTIRGWAGYASGVHTIDFTCPSTFGSYSYVGLVPATFGHWHSRIGNNSDNGCGFRVDGSDGEVFGGSSSLGKIGQWQGISNMRMRLVLNFNTKRIEIWYIMITYQPHTYHRIITRIRFI